MFMVGVAVPYSYARRAEEGHTFRRQFAHALVRAAVLVLLAVFLASGVGSGRTTRWEFTNVLGQIGLGYPCLLFLLNRRLSVQAAITAAILVGYWALFALYPAPAAGFAYAGVGVTPTDLAGGAVREGFFAHWNKNSNVAAAFDLWFLNLFPRSSPFQFNPGGYATLNFVPSLATMILGLMSGELLRGPRPAGEKVRRLLWGGLGLVLVGVVAGYTVCPIVKRIWTPSWALFSGGLVVWLLAAFYWVIDVAGYRRWSQFLVVVGMNSIAIYLMSQLMRPWMGEVLRTHLGAAPFTGAYGPMVRDLLTLGVFWVILWWMHRRRIFLRI
jgi:predicted acyltransferase